MEDDAELVERYVNGNRVAASLLVARHSASLFGWLHWKTGCREDAEDLAQIVWAQAFAALPGLRDPASFRAWLFTLCRHAFGHWLREHRTTTSLDALGGEAAGILTAPTNAMQAVEDRLALQNALMQLSEEHRDTFLLKYVSQFSAPEIAQILDIPVGTVESRCHFARVRLRQWLIQSEAAQAAQAAEAGELREPASLPTAGSSEDALCKAAKPALFHAAPTGVKAKKPGSRGIIK